MSGPAVGDYVEFNKRQQGPAVGRVLKRDGMRLRVELSDEKTMWIEMKDVARTVVWSPDGTKIAIGSTSRK